MGRNVTRRLLLFTLVVGAVGLAAPLRAAVPTGTLLATGTNASGQPVIWLVREGADAETFATLSPGTTAPGYGPMAFSPSGRLFVAAAIDGGSLWDVTDGGNRAADRPVAKGLFADQPRRLCGLAFDAAGNAYVSHSEAADEAANRKAQPIVRVDVKSGAVTALPVAYNHARGLAVVKGADGREILYIAEAGAGRVVTYDLTNGAPAAAPFATGFPPGTSALAGSLGVDRRGRLLLLWRLDPNDANTEEESSGALFDITAGGDFSDLNRTAPLIRTQFPIELSQFAFSAENYLYFPGGSAGTVLASDFQGDVWFQALTVAANLGNCPSIVVAP